MTFWKWSKTAAANATADGTVNWAEGMAPSAVNDSARAMMAAAAKHRDDVSGAITTAGTGAAYTLATFQAFESLAGMNGQMVAFVIHATNIAGCTLNVDGLGARPLRIAAGADLGPGVLVANTPYAATYFNGAGEWLLHGFYGNPYNIPLGGMLDFTGSAAPNSSFVLPFGQAISRATYAGYFALVGTTFGAGDGSSTFNVPDLRGRFVAGNDGMGGFPANRITNAVAGFNATIHGAVGGSEGTTLTLSNLPNVTLTVTGNVSTSATVIGQTAQGWAGTQSAATDSPSPTGAAPRAANMGAISFTSSFSNGVTSSINGDLAQTAFSRIPPTIVLNKILRVL